MTAKEFMRQYRRLTVRIRQLDEDIARLEAEIDSTAINYDGMPRGSKISNKTQTLAVQLAELKDKKVRLRSEAWHKREEIQAVIDSIENPVYASLLRCRYIDGLQWEETANFIGYESHYTRTRLHERALRSVTEIKNQKEPQEL